MEDNRSVIDRLNDIENKQDKTKDQNEQIIELLNNLNDKREKEKTIVQSQRNNGDIINNFIKRAKKEYLWVGPIDDFEKRKSKIILIGRLIILSSILASIITALSCRFFSIASLFELWWAILIIVITINHAKMKKKMGDTELMGVLCNEYEINTKYNVVLDTLVESGFYRWSRILSYIAVGVNCILIFAFINQVWLTIIAFLIELLYLALVIIFNIKRVDFDDSYDTFHILLTGMNDIKTEEVKIVLDLALHKILTYEEYKKIYKNEDF